MISPPAAAGAPAVSLPMLCRHSICILAGDISPIDVITHIPVVCEDHKVPYVYVPSKEVSSRGGGGTQ
jgi:ribosomal protein L7Ae-like RNA K-turn-binding protein